MKTNNNQSKRIYGKTTKQWYKIPEDQYRRYDCWRTMFLSRLKKAKWKLSQEFPRLDLPAVLRQRRGTRSAA